MLVKHESKKIFSRTFIFFIGMKLLPYKILLHKKIKSDFDKLTLERYEIAC